MADEAIPLAQWTNHQIVTAPTMAEAAAGVLWGLEKV
jgi:hypothetical protein